MIYYYAVLFFVVVLCMQFNELSLTPKGTPNLVSNLKDKKGRDGHSCMGAARELPCMGAVRELPCILVP
jgi:hypothetical protein